MLKATAIHYLTVYHSRKSRSRSAKKQRPRRLPHIRHPAQYERSRSSHWHTGTENGKRKTRSRRFDLFCKGQSHIWHLPPKTIPSCVTVHDNVTVAAMVSEIWTSQN